MAKQTTIVIGLCFIMIPVCIILKWNNLLALMIIVPLGLSWTVVAFWLITQPFRYCVKREVTYKQAVFDHTLCGRNRSIKCYALECSLQADGKEYKAKSKDTYTLTEINRKYIEGSTITVWFHKKKLTQFMVKRFQGAFVGLWLLIIGIAFLWIAVKVCIKM